MSMSMFQACARLYHHNFDTMTIDGINEVAGMHLLIIRFDVLSGATP